MPREGLLTLELQLGWDPSSSEASAAPRCTAPPMTVPMALAVLVVRACSLAEGLFWLSGASWVGLCWEGRSRPPEGVQPSAPLCWFSGLNPENTSVALVKFCVWSLGCAMVLVTTGRPALMEGPEASPGRAAALDPELSDMFLTRA